MKKSDLSYKIHKTIKNILSKCLHQYLLVLSLLFITFSVGLIKEQSKFYKIYFIYYCLL